MTWIDTVSPEEATGDIAKIYEAIGSARGGVAEIHRAQSLNPRATKSHMDLYRSVMFARSSLPRITRERIAVVVSHANRCRYCINHHAEALRQSGDDKGVVESLSKGDIPPSLESRERALLQWARQMTLSPFEASEKTIKELKAAGYNDRAILDASLVLSYFNFVNRLVLSLGVQLEENFEDYCGDETN